MLVDVDPETFLLRPELVARGADAPDAGGPRRAPVRPARRVGGAPDRRAAGRRARRGRRRRARRAIPRHAVRRARAARVPLLPPAEDRDDRRGRRGHDRRGRARRRGPPPPPSRDRAATGRSTSPSRASTTGFPTCSARSAIPQLERLEACSPRASGSPAGTRSGSSTSWARPPPRRATGTAGRRTSCALDRRDEALAGLRAEGIEAQIGTYAVHRLSAYRDRGSFPGADAAFERALALPFAASMTEDEVDRVARPLVRLRATAKIASSGSIRATAHTPRSSATSGRPSSRRSRVPAPDRLRVGDDLRTCRGAARDGARVELRDLAASSRSARFRQFHLTAVSSPVRRPGASTRRYRDVRASSSSTSPRRTSRQSAGTSGGRRSWARAEPFVAGRRYVPARLEREFLADDHGSPIMSCAVDRRKQRARNRHGARGGELHARERLIAP